PTIHFTMTVYLPDELILEILGHITAQRDLWSCSLINRAWNSCTVTLLYRRPDLYGKNLDPFVRTICPSINARIQHSALATLVRELDLSKLVHQGSKSVTARLLGRVKPELQLFIAPQATFSVACWPALSRCAKLQALDLSLISEAPATNDLLRTVAKLNALRDLRLPRSAVSWRGRVATATPVPWPKGLVRLTISGGVLGSTTTLATLPGSLRELELSHCPHARAGDVLGFLRENIADGVETLTVRDMPLLANSDTGPLDNLFAILPNLRRLITSVDYLTDKIFDTSAPLLETLELSLGAASISEEKLLPMDLLLALIEKKTLPSLRLLRASKSLAWDSPSDADDLHHLVQLLE
ncbi:hypothetical protein K470DRAFT_198612, partial [Piedraia hortae CBS 480.64]